TASLSDVESFALAMRMSAPPLPAAPTASTLHGKQLFTSVGCALCHTPALRTGMVGPSVRGATAVSSQTAQRYSDLLVHHMGNRLADGITQGAAGPDEFRTAPLWGVGQRVFFLHDGRTSNIVQAVQLHASQGSEANSVILNFASLSAKDQQDLINFLRS